MLYMGLQQDIISFQLHPSIMLIIIIIYNDYDFDDGNGYNSNNDDNGYNNRYLYNI